MKKNNRSGKPRDLIGLWERLELRITTGNETTTYLTRIEDIDKEALMVEQPVRISGALDLSVGLQVEAIFNRDDASYIFDAVITGIDSSRDNIHILQAVSDVRRQQRRKFVRIDIDGKLTYRCLETDASGEKSVSLQKNGDLINISAGGILMATTEHLKPEQIILLNFSLKHNQNLENILGITKRLEQSQNQQTGKNEILAGVEFLSREKFEEKYASDINEYLPKDVNYFDDALQQAIVRFVYKQQVNSRNKSKVTSWEK